MSRILLAALALVAGAACSGPLRVSGPGVVVETEPAERPPDPEIAEVTASVPRGMGLAVTTEAGDQAETEDAEAEAEAGNGGTPSGAQERISPESERPPSPAPDPSLASILVGELGAGRTEAGRWRDFVLAVMDRILGGPGSGPEPEPPPDRAEPVETEPEPEPPAESEPLANGRDHLREFIEADKGGYSAEAVAEAEAEARRVVGLGFPGLAAARRDALTALCLYAQCETHVHVIAAVRSGDFEAAAGEMFTRTVSTFGSDRAAIPAGWLRTGEYEPVAW